jgi:hypothetical protein
MYIKNLNFETDMITGLDVEIEFKTSYNGTCHSGHCFHNWAFIDFDRSDWFNVFLLSETHTAAFNSRGEDGVQDVVKGTTALNDGVWHTIKYQYQMTACNTRFDLYVDNQKEFTI